MHEAGRLLVHYLVNSVWQTPLLLIAAWMASRILQKLGSAAQHRLWVGALLLAVLAPVGTMQSKTVGVHLSMDQGPVHVLADAPGSPEAAGRAVELIRLRPALYLTLLFGYLIFLGLAALRLGWGLYKTRRIAGSATAAALPPNAAEIWRRCSGAFATGGAGLAFSSEINGPVTVGVRNAVLLMPPGFLFESIQEDLAAALGHECAHLERRDFFLNLLYEFIALPIAYHPAAWMMKSRIAETRELICDRMAAERLAGSRSYARSLLRLAAAVNAAPMANSHHAIGMFDANTLENRIMHLTTPVPLISQSKRAILLTSGILLLSLSGAAALAFTSNVQEQSSSVEQPAAASAESAASQQSTSALPSQSTFASAPQAYEAGKIYHVGGVVSAPVLVHSVDPEFSDQARRKKYQGTCVVSFIVDTRGNPQAVKVIRHLGMGLDEKAVEAIKQYRFKPARLEGKPVPVKVDVNIQFKIY